MLIPTLLSLSALALAAPILEQRDSCSIAYPSLAFQLISTAKDNNTNNHDYVATGFSGSETEYVTELHFDPLARDVFKYGPCRLQLYFPANGQGRLETNRNNHKLSFYSLNGTVKLEDTWNMHPKIKALVGTVNVEESTTGGDTVLEVNSPACSVEGDGTAGLDYRVEIEKSAGQKEGFVGWWQEGGAGVRVLYNC